MKQLLLRKTECNPSFAGIGYVSMLGERVNHRSRSVPQRGKKFITNQYPYGVRFVTRVSQRDSSYYTYPKGGDKDKVVSITYEEIGLFPRSFSRVLDRFLKQLFSDVDNLVIQEYRFYRYLFLTTIKTIFILFFVPFVVNFVAKNYVVKPVTEYFWNTQHPEIFLNSYEQKRAFAELEKFEEKIYFEALVQYNNDRFKIEGHTKHKGVTLNSTHASIPTLHPLSYFYPNEVQGPVGVGKEIVAPTQGESNRIPLPTFPYPYGGTKGVVLTPPLLGPSPSKGVAKERLFFTHTQKGDPSPFVLTYFDLPPPSFSTFPYGESKGVKTEGVTNEVIPFGTVNKKYLQSLPRVKGPVGILPPLVGKKNEGGGRHKPIGERIKLAEASNFSLLTPLFLTNFNLPPEGVTNEVIPFPSLVLPYGKEREGPRVKGPNGVLPYPSLWLGISPKGDPKVFPIGERKKDEGGYQSQLSQRTGSAFGYPEGNGKAGTAGIPYNLSKDVFKIYQEKTIELATYYNNHSIEAITNFFADLLSLCALLYLLVTLEIQINITKSFLAEVFFGLDDSKKSLLILLVTDLLVGYHSSNLWELFFQFIFNHYGIPESQTGIFLLVATLPVLLDVLFKYLIFRHLNRSSPATVATYQAIIE